jgi:EAL domain-containing protein (putative c-di-GMP-specific phosphodiesterase class I)
VETIEQLQALQDARCDEVQGYFLSRPMDAQAIGHLIGVHAKHSGLRTLAESAFTES